MAMGDSPEFTGCTNEENGIIYTYVTADYKSFHFSFPSFPSFYRQGHPKIKCGVNAPI